MKTRLILIDGISGSGKSTTTQFIATQFVRNNYPVRWYHEEETDHPLDYHETSVETLFDPLELARFKKRIPEQWREFVQKALVTDEVYLIESYIFQDTLRILFQNNEPEEEIQAFSQVLLEIIRPLNPVLIYLYKRDVADSFRNVWKKRGERWAKWCIDTDTSTPYAKAYSLLGPEGVIVYWMRYQELTHHIYEQYDLPKIAIENSAGEWCTYRKRILKFLGLTLKPEPVIESDLAEYTGTYKNEAKSCKIVVKKGQLICDIFWPDIRLFVKESDIFHLESYPVELVFTRDLAGKVTKFHITGAPLYGATGREFSKVDTAVNE